MNQFLKLAPWALLLGTPGALSATTARSIGPLATFDDIAVQEVVLGDTLAWERLTAVPLFGTDFKKADELKGALASRVSSRLVRGGLKVDSRSKNSIFVSVYGGKFPDAGCNKNFFVLEILVGGPKDPVALPARTIVGVATDDELAPMVLDAASSAIDEFTAQRKAYWETKHK